MITIGTDIEFFLQDKKGNLLSATRFLKGSKKNPEKLRCGGILMHDNVAFEFATPIASGEDEFIDVIRSSLSESVSRLPPGIILNQSPSSIFGESELQDRRTKRFGCSPDFDAWRLEENEVPAEAACNPFRSCGGHIHVGYVEGSGNDFLKDPMGKVEMVKAMDLLLGVPFTILDYSQETIDRRNLYGKAGCHRPTSYGVEYRALSNFWTLSPKTVRAAYKLVLESLALVREDRLDDLLYEVPEDTIVRTINLGDRKEAKHIWKGVLSKELSECTVDTFNQCSKVYNLYDEWGV